MQDFFAKRVFDIFDRDGSETVSLQEFVQSVEDFTLKRKEDKLRFLFKIYDLNGDGFVQFDEMRRVLTACMEENGFSFSAEQIRKFQITSYNQLLNCIWTLSSDELTTVLYEEANSDEN